MEDYSKNQLSETRKASPRVARRRAATRRKIIQISSRMFSLLGFEAVKFEDIANAADVARGTLYSYFKNKETLLGEILTNVFQHALAGMEKIKKTNPRESVEQLLHLYCDLWETDPDSLRVVHRFEEMPLETHRTLYQAVTARIEAIFEAAGQRGLLRSGDPRIAARLFERTTIPSLEVFSGLKEDFRRQFVDHLNNLLLVPRLA